jgi:4-amino-4-deoxy-L-arabinose transferase-like glycosyltransferase
VAAAFEPDWPASQPSNDVASLSVGFSRPLTTFLRIVIVAQILAIITFGSITIEKYPLWSLVDEGAHFDNIEYIAQHHSLPVLGKVFATQQELAIGQGIYPKHSNIDPKTSGLPGLAYEAFQPPLYYLVATPFYFLNGNFHSKAIILRFLGLGLLVVSIALLARLSRHVLKQRWLLGLGGGLLIFLMPGIITRSVTISNFNLALPLVIAAVTEMWIAWERRSSNRLITGGFLVGCGVLTDLYLAELVPVFLALAAVLFLGSKDRGNHLRCAIAVGLAAIVTLPWFIFNEIEYHALTASDLAKREQLHIVNPQHLHFGLGQLPGLTVQTLFNPLLPQEWSHYLDGSNLLAYGATIFQVLIVPAAIVLAVALGRRILTTGFWLLLLPFLCNLALCWYIDYGQQWESGSMVGRYVYPTLPILAIFIVGAATQYVRSARTWATLFVVTTAFLIVVWVHIIPMIPKTAIS